MPLIDAIKQMQQQGLTDSDIIQQLKEQGYNPKEIDEALAQSKIKSAVYEETGQSSVISSQQEMMPSVMTQEIPQQGQISESYQQQYPQVYQEYYQPSSNLISNEMITEIAEQIVSEKLAEIRKTLSNLSEFRTTAESKITNIDERLKKIEKTIENLQLAVLNKIGEHFSSVQDIKSELEMMQDSFSKVINPLADKSRKKQPSQPSEPSEQQSEETPEQESKQQRKKRGDGFENYLR